jgi:prepilin-type N-terminal cleavage/methylation domain-containing protein
MFSRRSIPRSRLAERRAGFSLVELLVAMGLVGIALAVFVKDVGFSVRQRRDMDLVLETQQALSATETFLTQELRQAGACLPANGEFVALAGENGGTSDSLTLRIGVADRATLLCVQSILTSDAPAMTSRLTLQSTDGFEKGQWVYVTRLGGDGSFFRISSVGSDFLLIEGSLDEDYVAGGGVFAVEERRYTLDQFDGIPALMVSVDGGTPQPMVAGIEELDFRYRLEPCPPCTAIDLPSSSAEWRSVREIEMRVVARSTQFSQQGAYHRLDATTTIRPRNMI